LCQFFCGSRDLCQAPFDDSFRTFWFSANRSSGLDGHTAYDQAGRPCSAV